MAVNLAPARDTAVTGWYSRGAPSRSQEILADAFQEAKSIFTRELSTDERKHMFFADASSISDVQSSLEDAQKAYKSKTQSKARKWLTAVSERLMFYAQVFDMLAQHHPEYVALAWGAFKFMFVAILNHEELIKKISKGLSQIADILPRTQLNLILYPTDMMQEALARVYAHIMRFFQQAVCWYKQGKLMHSVTSVIRPWAITFQEHLDVIREESRRLDHHSNMAAKAELRDTHLEIIGARKDWIDTTSELRVLQADNRRLMDLVGRRFDHVDQNIISLHKSVRLGLHEQNDALSQIQLNQILSLTFIEKLPTSGECLQYCQSIRSRRRDRVKLLLPDVLRLRQWAAQPKASLFVMQGSSATVTKSFMVDLVNLIRDVKLPIIWALRYANYWESTVTCTDILRMLVMQALQINPCALAVTSNPITVAHMREAVSVVDWLRILDRALQGVPCVFIVLDTGLLSHVTAHNRHQATELVESLRSGLSSSVKIFVSTFNLQEVYISDIWHPDQCMTLRTDISSNRISARNYRRKNAPSKRSRLPQGRIPVSQGWQNTFESEDHVVAYTG